MNHSNSLGFLPPQDPRWLDLIQSNPRASLLHHLSWINLLAHCCGYQGLVLTLPASQNEIRAGVPIMEINISERFEKDPVWKLQSALLLGAYL